MNKAILIGRTGNDPETSTLESGKKVTKFSLATTELYHKENNVPTWHNIVIWGDYGETMSKYITKGSQLMIEGRIQNEIYETNEGIKKSYTTIVTEKVELLDSKKSSETASTPVEKTVKEPVAEPVASKPVAETDDLPF